MAEIVVIGTVVGAILAVCWIILPFALIGTKPILRSIDRRLERSNELAAEQNRMLLVANDYAAKEAAIRDELRQRRASS